MQHTLIYQYENIEPYKLAILPRAPRISVMRYLTDMIIMRGFIDEEEKANTEELKTVVETDKHVMERLLGEVQ